MKTVIDIPITHGNDISLIYHQNKVNIKTMVNTEQNILKLSFEPEMDSMALRQVNLHVSFCLVDSDGNKGRIHTVDKVLTVDNERKWYILKYRSKCIINNMLRLEVTIGRCDYTLNIEHILKAIYYATKADGWEHQQQYIKTLELQLKKDTIAVEQLENMDEETLDQLQNKILEIKRERRLCCICKYNCWTHTCVPCGHSVCEECSNIYDREKGCPLCRADISDIIKVYK